MLKVTRASLRKKRLEFAFHSSRRIGISLAQHHKQNSLCYYSNHGIYKIIEHPNVRFDTVKRRVSGFLTKDRNNINNNFLGG